MSEYVKMRHIFILPFMISLVFVVYYHPHAASSYFVLLLYLFRTHLASLYMLYYNVCISVA
jgi:hypothetical protein